MGRSLEDGNGMDGWAWPTRMWMGWMGVDGWMDEWIGEDDLYKDMDPSIRLGTIRVCQSNRERGWMDAWMDGWIDG